MCNISVQHYFLIHFSHLNQLLALSHGLIINSWLWVLNLKNSSKCYKTSVQQIIVGLMCKERKWWGKHASLDF